MDTHTSTREKYSFPSPRVREFKIKNPGTLKPDFIHERSIFEAPRAPSTSKTRIRPKPTPKPHQMWKPKSELKQNNAAARVSSPSRTCEQDKEDINALDVKATQAASVKANTSSHTAHVIATTNRFQALCDELEETS
ncbi:hypothetical protein Bca101_076109 [Brassica carinata]